MKLVNYLMILAVIMAELAPVAEGKKPKKKKEQAQKKRDQKRFQDLYDQNRKKEECEGLAVDELAHQCACYKISPECFAQNYGAKGLEFGEEDTQK